MAGPVTGSLTPDPRWQLDPPSYKASGDDNGTSPLTGTGKPLDLSLHPEDFRPNQETPGQSLVVMPIEDWSLQSRSYERDGFDQRVQFNTPSTDHPMTKGEFIQNAREGLHDALGDTAATGVEAAVGIAHVLNGGKVKVTRDVQVFEQPAQINFNASARHGGSVGIEFKMNLGGR